MTNDIDFMNLSDDDFAKAMAGTYEAPEATKPKVEHHRGTTLKPSPKRTQGSDIDFLGMTDSEFENYTPETAEEPQYEDEKDQRIAELEAQIAGSKSLGERMLESTHHVESMIPSAITHEQKVIGAIRNLDSSRQQTLLKAVDGLTSRPLSGGDDIFSGQERYAGFRHNNIDHMIERYKRGELSAQADSMIEALMG